MTRRPFVVAAVLPRGMLALAEFRSALAQPLHHPV
jgi:hypothetical protein